MLRGVRPLGGPAGEIAVERGVFVDPADLTTGARVIDCGGLIALPGLVDLHTHLRQPGREDAETIESGTLAAAQGGYTAVCAMANTDPVADRPDIVEQVRQLGEKAGRCDVHPVGAVTVNLEGAELADIAGMASSAAHVRLFSDDGRCITDARMMREGLRAVSAVGGVLAQHAQEPSLTAGAQLNEGDVSHELGLPGWPAVAEEIVIARDCLLAHHERARLHVCHVSTAGSVEVIAWAKRRGWPVTAEVTPHHLLLTEEDTRSGDPVYKVNPPLRTAADVNALRAALVDGTIDAVATDHAPHPAIDKARNWCQAPMGMLGLETALAVIADTFVATGQMSWATLAERMSHSPARIAGIATRHTTGLDLDGPATLCLVDPAAGWTVTAEELGSRSRNTPFAGHAFSNRVIGTLLRGAVTHDRIGING